MIQNILHINHNKRPNYPRHELPILSELLRPPHQTASTPPLVQFFEIMVHADMIFQIIFQDFSNLLLFLSSTFMLSQNVMRKKPVESK